VRDIMYSNAHTFAGFLQGVILATILLGSLDHATPLPAPGATLPWERQQGPSLAPLSMTHHDHNQSSPIHAARPTSPALIPAPRVAAPAPTHIPRATAPSPAPHIRGHHHHLRAAPPPVPMVFPPTSNNSRGTVSGHPIFPQQKKNGISAVLCWLALQLTEQEPVSAECFSS
jgi:hypothetical protein